MALSRAKYKRLPDLYVQGTEVVLSDGSVMWLQVLNPFQADEARHDAQVARSRLIMALKEHGGDEMAFIEAQLWQDGIEGARKRVVESKSGDLLIKVVEEVRNDPEWTDRLEIMNRTEEEDRPLEEAERALLTKIQGEYVQTVQDRMADEQAFVVEQFKDADEQTLKDEYARLYIDRRGADLATAEYRVVELWYGARACEGKRLDDGSWDHAACEGHQVQVFETKAEVRTLPEELAQLLGEAYTQLSMSIRDAKDLARPASSSDSSRRPGAEEESMPSTPVETPSRAPGTSPQRSRMLSRS